MKQKTMLGLAGAVIGLGGTIFGAAQQRKAAREQEKALEKQRAVNEAWYNRNYYQDYLNTVEAQNAMRRYRNAWADQTREARARQAVTGGTPEQAVAVAEAGGEAMGNMIGNLAAAGQQNKQAIDAQKMAMDTNLANQQAQIAEAREAANAILLSNSANLIASGLQGMKKTDAVPPAGAKIQLPRADTSHVIKPGEPLPDSIKPLKLY